jgi:hypothetical protein
VLQARRAYFRSSGVGIEDAAVAVALIPVI